MTKNKSTVIKNYILDPDRLVLGSKTVRKQNFVNRSEITSNILKSVINNADNFSALEGNHCQSPVHPQL